MVSLKEIKLALLDSEVQKINYETRYILDYGKIISDTLTRTGPDTFSECEIPDIMESFSIMIEEGRLVSFEPIKKVKR